MKERFGLCKQCKHFEAGRIDRTGRKPMGLCHHGPQHHPHWGTDWCGQFDVQVAT